MIKIYKLASSNCTVYETYLNSICLKYNLGDKF